MRLFYSMSTEILQPPEIYAYNYIKFNIAKVIFMQTLWKSFNKTP